ncbi:MAG TPA: hypothetical protein VK211_03585 [Kamptonema sp.]|nr:hypothetical protein [Kamptonema sp.]
MKESLFSLAERLESLKAGILAALSLLLAFGMAETANSLMLAKSLETLPAMDFNLVVRGAIALISGFLFGATYRYAIRRDTNPHLKSGVVLAFGLVRGFGQLDIGLSNDAGILLDPNIWLFAAMDAESILMFAIASLSLDFAIQHNWIKPFNSN